MTDQELTAWLRDLAEALGKEAFTRAADRIEELVKEVERRIEPEQVENLVKMADPIMSELYAIEYSCRQEAEAKLTKAMEALRFYAPQTVGGITFVGGDDAGKRAAATLAELEGEKK